MVSSRHIDYADAKYVPDTTNTSHVFLPDHNAHGDVAPTLMTSVHSNGYPCVFTARAELDTSDLFCGGVP